MRKAETSAGAWECDNNVNPRAGAPDHLYSLTLQLRPNGAGSQMGNCNRRKDLLRATPGLKLFEKHSSAARYALMSVAQVSGCAARAQVVRLTPA